MMALALASCGSDEPSEPSPTPTPTPPTLVYLLDDDAATVSVVAVDVATGSPTLLQTTPIPGAQAVAVDPYDRLLYVAGEDDELTRPQYLRSYAIDRQSGALAGRSEALYTDSLSSMAANASAVFLRTYRSADPIGKHYYCWLSSYGVEPATGRLTRQPEKLLLSGEGMALAVDPSGPYLYGVADHNLSGDTDRNALDTYVFDAGTPTGCRKVASLSLDTSFSAGAVVAGGQLVVSNGDDILYRYTLDRSTGGVSPAARTGVPGTRHLAGSGRWLADGWYGGYQDYLRLYTVTAEGELALRDEIAAEGRSLRSVAFDPSGQLVFSVERDGLQVYAVDAGGHLEVRGLLPSHVDQLVVARPPE
jgi:hypothetical protein